MLPLNGLSGSSERIGPSYVPDAVGPSYHSQLGSIEPGFNLARDQLGLGSVNSIFYQILVTLNLDSSGSRFLCPRNLISLSLLLFIYY